MGKVENPEFLLIDTPGYFNESGAHEMKAKEFLDGFMGEVGISAIDVGFYITRSC